MLHPTHVFPVIFPASLLYFELSWPFSSRSFFATVLGYSGCLIFSFLTWFIYSAFLWPGFLSPLRKFPTPKELKWWKLNLRIREPKDYERWAHEVDHDGFIRYFSILNQEHLLVLHEDGIRDVSQHTDIIQRPRTLIVQLIIGSRNLLTLYGEPHRIARRYIQPAFNLTYVKEMYPIMQKKAVELVSVLSKQASASEAIQISESFSHTTMDVVGLAGFGMDFNSIKDPHGEVPSTYSRCFDGKDLRRLYILSALLPKWRWLLYKANPRLVESSTRFQTIAKTVITKRQEDIENKKVDIGKKDILGLFLKDRNMPLIEVIDHCKSFLIAGHDTTSAGLTWALHELCHNPDLQKTLRDDIRKIVPSPKSGEQVTPAHMDQLPRLTGFVNEVLRFHAPVAQLIRVTNQTVTVGNQIIPKGAVLRLSPRASNRLPRHWPTSSLPPTTFDPNRFLANPSDPHTKLTSGGASSIYSNTTFFTGPKNCIGERFARAEMAIVLAMLVGTFDIRLAGYGQPGQMKLEQAKRQHVVSDEIVGGLWVEVDEVEGW